MEYLLFAAFSSVELLFLSFFLDTLRSIKDMMKLSPTFATSFNSGVATIPYLDNCCFVLGENASSFISLARFTGVLGKFIFTLLKVL